MNHKDKANPLVPGGSSQCTAIGSTQVHPGAGDHNLRARVYAPTSSHSDDEVEEFYDLLNKACDEHRGTWTLVMGDYNSKIGPRLPTDSKHQIQHTPEDYSCPDDFPMINGFEVHQALRHMKYNRSPGADGITTESLRAGERTLIPYICNFFNTILRTDVCRYKLLVLNVTGRVTSCRMSDEPLPKYDPPRGTQIARERTSRQATPRW
uniref:Endonuclease/exonuclease/phosphatase domain-containing protein n=1 Tax=Heliothis virescens TaxID=7102 RepID=A0A2A4JJ14_HELVI